MSQKEVVECNETRERWSSRIRGAARILGYASASPGLLANENGGQRPP